MFDYNPPQADIQCLHEDESLLVVIKPPELLSVPGRRPEHRDSLISRLQLTHPEALIVHRLDMSTSGLLLLARNLAAQRHLGRQFEQRQVKKKYLALVKGEVVTERGEVNLPLGRDWPNRPRQKVDYVLGKQAHTEYRLIDYDPTTDCSRVELTPTTGRTHQLRVHMQALGHPILGDDLYADETTCKMASRLLLHACTLEFAHPASGKLISFSHPAPF